MTYQNPRTRATAPSPSSPSNSHRASFARQAAIDAFGPRAVHHLTDEVFVDREPAGADDFVDGHDAIIRLLKSVINSDGSEQAEIAFERADQLRQILHFEWADVLSREAA